MAKKKVTLETPEKVKILGISGSPRKAITADMVKFTLKAAESMGYVETEYISLADHHFSYCTDCKKCWDGNRPPDDPIMCYEDPTSESEMVHNKSREADAVVLGFPVYGGHQPALLRMAMEVRSHSSAAPGGAGSAIAGAGGFSTTEDYKPAAIISQGGNVYSSQELQYWFTVHKLGALISAAWPTVEDPEPQASFAGGMLHCQDGLSVFRKDAWTSAGSRIWPPLTGIQNERTLRNLGRWLAVAAMMMKLGRLACKEGEIQTPQIGVGEWVRWGADKPKPGSVLEKLVKEGKMTYVTPGELEARKKVRT